MCDGQVDAADEIVRRGNAGPNATSVPPDKTRAPPDIPGSLKREARKFHGFGLPVDIFAKVIYSDADRDDRRVNGRVLRMGDAKFSIKIGGCFMLRGLSSAGLTSEMMYAAGFASIGASFLCWVVSRKGKHEGLDRADRWGIFVGEWAPTFFALGVGLRLEESSNIHRR